MTRELSTTETTRSEISDYMSTIGKRGGSSRSPRKQKAARLNGLKGGRPKDDGTQLAGLARELHSAEEDEESKAGKPLKTKEVRGKR